ncbi:MAG: methionine aminopeptidase [Ornithinimicrobium sp.]|uniref:methionine aminopeptidase n=1 Tax=Ornithinimicrobium sp. TaxID=1977084 RepID=UPI003D9B7286
MQYWFNVDSHEVEAHDDPKRARAAQLMGPYDTHAEADQALAKAAERTAEWDEQNRKDDGWDDKDSS